MKHVYHNGLKALVAWEDGNGRLHIEPVWSGPLGFLAWVSGRIMTVFGRPGRRHAKDAHRKVIIRS